MSLSVAMVYGVAFIIVFYYIFVKDLMQKPDDVLNSQIWKYLRFKDVGVFLYLLGAFLLVGFSGLLLIMAEGQPYELAIQSFFTAFGYVVAGFFLAYSSIYIIFRIKQELESVGKTI